MTVPGWMYWLTYLAVPIFAALVVGLERAGVNRLGHRPAQLARARRWAGVALLASGAINSFEMVRMVGDLNAFGLLLCAAILGSQLGLGVMLVRRRPEDHGAAPHGNDLSRERLESGLAIVATLTALAMLAVRAQIVWIFG